MAKFVVNLEMAKQMPGAVPCYEVEAEGYEEEGSFTVFRGEGGEMVKSVRTDTVFSIDRKDTP